MIYLILALVSGLPVVMQKAIYAQIETFSPAWGIRARPPAVRRQHISPTRHAASRVRSPRHCPRT